MSRTADPRVLAAVAGALRATVPDAPEADPRVLAATWGAELDEPQRDEPPGPELELALRQARRAARDRELDRAMVPELAAARAVAGLTGATPEQTEAALARELGHAQREHARGSARRAAPSSAQRRRMADARRLDFRRALAEAGAPACAPRDWASRVWTLARMVRGALDGRPARDLCAELPRDDARALRRAAVCERDDAGRWHVVREWSHPVARLRVVLAVALRLSRARTRKAGCSAATAGFSVGMLAALYPGRDGSTFCREYVSAQLSALQDAGVFYRAQPPRALRDRFAAYYGPSGYGFNVYWWPERAGDGSVELDQVGTGDVAAELAPVSRRARDRAPPN